MRFFLYIKQYKKLPENIKISHKIKKKIQKCSLKKDKKILITNKNFKVKNLMILNNYKIELNN